jgi:hypothetical protein
MVVQLLKTFTFTSFDEAKYASIFDIHSRTLFANWTLWYIPAIKFLAMNVLNLSILEMKYLGISPCKGSMYTVQAVVIL